MDNFNITIISDNIAILNINESENTFSIYPVSPVIYRFGFFENPLFEIEISLSEERIIIETLADGQILSNSPVSLPPVICEWFSGTYCTDFSIFNYLPTGKYRLVKTGRKPVFNNRVLLGNEWSPLLKIFYALMVQILIRSSYQKSLRIIQNFHFYIQ
jgi:hypothetical protein